MMEPYENHKNYTVGALEKHGKCPLDYEPVKNMGTFFSCKRCGARLERQHVFDGRRSFERVQGRGYYFPVNPDKKHIA
jgi:hypothetical protein